MAVVAVKEKARDTAEASADVTTLTRTFLIRVDDALDTVVTAASGFGLPVYGESHPDFIAARMVSVSVQRLDNSRIHFEATYTYSTEAPEIDDPLSRPAELSFGFEKFQRPIAKDINGAAIVNSAKDYYDPPPEIDDSRPVLTITKNVAIFDADTAIAYQDAVNSTPFIVLAPGFLLSAAAGLAKIDNISGRSMTERIGGPTGSTVFYWQATFDIAFRREGWLLEPLDHGYNELKQVGTSGVYKRNRIVTDNGEPVSNPVLLDGSGEKLDVSSGSPTPVFGSHIVYKQLDFNLLGLP